MSGDSIWTPTYWSRASRRRLSRRRLIKLGAITAAGAAGAGYLGCGGEEEEGKGGTPGAGETPAAIGTPSRGGSFTSIISSAFSTTDPAFYGNITDKFMFNVYDAPQVNDLDEEKNIVLRPILAESWEIPDGSHLVWHWRRGVKFQDGTDFTAASVKSYFDRIANPETKSTHIATLEFHDHVENPDDYTSVFVLKKPNAEVFIWAFNYWMASIPSAAAVEKWGNDYRNHPVGTGPFMLKRQEPGTRYEFERFPEHWRKDEPFVDAFNIRVIPDKAVAAAALKAGEADYAEQSELDTADIVAFKNDAEFNVVVGGIAALGQIFIHKGREPGNNLHLRKAISYAVNRDEFVEKYSGLAFITPGPLPRYTVFDTPEEPDPEFNPEKAKEELKAAGYEGGVTITMRAMAEATSQSDVELLAAQLGKVGINVEASFVSPGAAGAMLSQGDYDFAYGPWPLASPGDIEYSNYNIYQSNGFFNGGSTVDPEIDRLEELAWLEPDYNKKRDYFRQVMRIVNENAYLVYVVGLPQVVVMRKNLHGFIPMNEPGGWGLERQFRRFWIA